VSVSLLDRLINHGPFVDYEHKNPRRSSRNILGLRGTAHANRRRLWNRGLSSESVQDYEPLLEMRITQLLGRLEGFRDGPVDIAKWFGFFTFDFMGDMAYVYRRC
jgi:cytochrome P450